MCKLVSKIQSVLRLPLCSDGNTTNVLLLLTGYIPENPGKTFVQLASLTSCGCPAAPNCAEQKMCLLDLMKRNPNLVSLDRFKQLMPDLKELQESQDSFMPLLACKRHTTLAKNPLIFIPLFLFLPVFFLSPSISELTPNSYSGRQQYYHESTHFLLDFMVLFTEDHQNDKTKIFMTLTPKQKVGVTLGDESFLTPHCK